MKVSLRANTARIRVVDVGGTHVKVLATGQKGPRKIPSGPTMTAMRFLEGFVSGSQNAYATGNNFVTTRLGSRAGELWPAHHHQI